SGTQYRSAIFCHGEEQLAVARASLAAAQPRFGDRIVTQVAPAQEFWRAEDYHQNYFQKNPNTACHI
ncbi:MAG: peptide-methionine (S)-S-oxide reductase, partial [Methanobacteriota archaeon]